MFWRFELPSTYIVINIHVYRCPPRNFGRHVWQPPQELVWQLYQKTPKGVQERTPGLHTATFPLLKHLHESAPRPGHRQHLLRHVHRMHACNCVRMKHWRRQAQPVHVLHNDNSCASDVLPKHVTRHHGSDTTNARFNMNCAKSDHDWSSQHHEAMSCWRKPDAVMFASRIKPKVLSDPLPLSGCVVAAFEEELEPAVSPPAVVGGARHGGCPTASVATARATSNRSAAASNQGADFAGEAPKEALAGPSLSLG